MVNEEPLDLLVDGEVSASSLMRELLDTIGMSASWADNCRLAEDMSWCVWPGQTDDGLKHAWPGDEEPPFPWENASDTRVRLVEQKVREQCRIEILAAKRGNWSFQGINDTDFLQARRNVQLLKWQEAKHIPMARRERNLWIYWSVLYGCSVMGLGWKEEEALGLRTVTVDEIVQSFMERMPVEEADQYIATLRYILSNPDEAEDWLEAWLGEFFPDAKPKRLKQAAQELIESGEAEVPELRVMGSYPCWRAMKPMEDVFFPLDTESMQTARWVATRQWLTRAELEARREEWGDAFVDELLEHEGASTTLGLEDYYSNDVYGKRRWGQKRRSVFSQVYERSGLFEVFEFYHRSVDGDGVPGIYKSVMSPHVSDGEDGYVLAEQGLYDDGTGRMPFEEKTIWDDRRALLECEGLPHLIYTHQQEIKTLRDGRLDLASLSILPPLRRHARDKNIPLILGPDMPVWESVPGSTQWMDPPNGKPALAVELERAVERDANRIAGQADAEVPDVIVQVNQEYIVDQSTEAYGRVLSHTFQLNQQFLDEVVVTRVAGAVGGPFKVSKAEIQGQFDIMLTFDPRELDMDYAVKKFEAVTRIATELDKNAITDANMLVKMGYGIVAPDWADMLVTDENAAGQKEIRAAKDAINDIIAGQMPDLDGTMNAQLRLQYFMAQKQQNPVLMQIEGSEGDLRAEVLAKYEQHLKHMHHQTMVAPAEGRAGVKLGAEY